jgi:hypothetical protein
LLGLYIDYAINEITQWRHLSDETEFLNGIWDIPISEFVCESLVANGSEGKSGESGSGMTSSYYADPITNLRSRVPQRLG